MPGPVPPPISWSEIAGIAVTQLAAQFGTPTFVYDAALIRRRLADLAAFDHVRYAQKACSNLAVLDLVRRAGALVDAVSAGEIGRALAAGYQAEGRPPPIVYTADIFDAEALDLCVQRKIHVNCGSPDMIDQFGDRAAGREITLRINPGFGHGHSRKTNTGGDQSKHGIWHGQIGDCLARARHYGLTISGLHMHIGSGTDLEHLSGVCAAMEQAAIEVGDTVRSISAGGGLPVPYREGETYVDLPAYFNLWDATRQRLEARLGRRIALEIEPGRYLVAESGYLVTEIRAIKRQGENLFYLLDAGFNNLARPILYGSYHPMGVVPRGRSPFSPGGLSPFSPGGLSPFSPQRSSEAPEDVAAKMGTVPFGEGPFAKDAPPLVDVIVGGPLCESGDIFTQSEGGYVCTHRLPEARVGDLLVIGCAGAYGFVMGSNYNSRPLAAEVLIQDGRPHLVRRRQTFDDLVRGETVP